MSQSISSHDLYNSATWQNPDVVHGHFAKLRQEDPVHFCPSTEYANLWHITKHADIFEVEKRRDVFLNEPRLIISPLRAEAKVQEFTGGSRNLIRSLVTMDPPEHPKLRMLTQEWFMPKNLSKLQGSIDGSASEGIRTMIARKSSCDFAQDVAIEFPLRVIMSVLGVPAEDYGRMLQLTQELFGPEDPDTKRDTSNDGPDGDILGTYLDFANYFNAITEDRRKNPRDDVASIVANAIIDGEPISNDFALGYYIIVATAGHDTTCYSLTEAVHHLARNPDLFARLKADPQTVAPLIVEEAIRYAAPVRHFVRTAAQDYELRGKTIREGDSVILWYPSGSRDEDIFEQPDVFDIDRDQSTRHAAFGHGAHMCLGMHLARQENTAFLVQLAEALDTLQLAGEPDYVQAHFVSGIKRLPITYTLA